MSKITPQERAFLDASIAVWREVDRLEAEGPYPGIPPETDLRQREREAWNRYRDEVLDASSKPADVELVIDIEPMRDVLVGLLGADAVRAMPDDLLGAMAYGIALVRQAPVEQRMEAMGMTKVGWTYPENRSGYFCGGAGVDTPDGMPTVYAEREMAERKAALRSKMADLLGRGGD